jgi:hypothetical protein
MPRKATPGPRVKHPAVSVTFEKDALRSSPAKWLQSPEDVAVVNDYDKDGRLPRELPPRLPLVSP